MMPRGTELLIIFLVILLLFGATRLPQLGASLGSAIRNFKKGFGGEEERPEEKKDTGTLSSTSGAPKANDPASTGTRQGANRDS